MPHINHVLRNFYKKYPESIEISLESIGETPTTTKPTILVICTSVTKVRSILKKSLVYDKSVYGLKVCRGKVVRSRKHGARRSMAGGGNAANREHQERPSNGASIGAYVNDRHLPPVSFGGLIMIDDKPYGMSVHHMLDDPSDSESDDADIAAPILRSSAQGRDMPDLTYSESSAYDGSSDEEYRYTLSDYDSDSSSLASFSDSEFSDSYESDNDNEDDEQEMEPGDIRGIPQGCGESYLVTQPAIDDVPDDFYPSEETRDEDHLDSFQLGEIYASSGIRRRADSNGVVHEIDWALFEFESGRLPSQNHIQNSSSFCPLKPGTYPLTVTKTKDLSDLPVHCMARTSGLQSGRILPGMVIVKIFGRQTPSSSYQVVGNGKLGIPGDSGAWVVDNEEGRVAGHVLAWSSKKRVAYICPMEVLVHDIGETLGARSICLPGGEELYASTSTSGNKALGQIKEEEEVAKGMINEDISSDDLSRLLRDLRLPPTPEQIDNLSLNSHPSFPTEDGNENENVDGKTFIPIRMTTGNDHLLPAPQNQKQVARHFFGKWGLGSSSTDEGRPERSGFVVAEEEINDSGVEAGM
jgi:hypothetical protein